MLAIVVVIWLVMSWINDAVDPLMNYYIALVAMYATAMFGMVILVGLSGQVSLGNGALMAIGGYIFALTSLNWQTVPILGLPMNGVVVDGVRRHRRHGVRSADRWARRAAQRPVPRRPHAGHRRRHPGHREPVSRRCSAARAA